MGCVAEIAPHVPMATTCKALGLNRATVYRHKERRRGDAPRRPRPRSSPPRSLKAMEKQAVLDLLHSPRFVDQAPASVYAKLLDEGTYLCSVRTMYRLLAACNEVRERRNQLRHPEYRKPELLATGPNQVWSWDITKLKGPSKWTYFYLFVILDIFSRYVVGWMIAHRESGSLARHLIDQTIAAQGIGPDQLTLHADRGSPMKAKPVAFLLSDLGVTKSQSRPYTSNDNPYSESQFKTLKYRPDFPQRFGSMEDAKAHARAFFSWYNNEHRLGLMTPFQVHYGDTTAIQQKRAEVLNQAFQQHPERFVRKVPEPPACPTSGWINPSKNCQDEGA